MLWGPVKAGNDRRTGLPSAINGERVCDMQWFQSGGVAMFIDLSQPGMGPVTHAFIVGVSDYPFADGPKATADGERFGIKNLRCAARSASEVAAWLLNEFHNPDAPLGSLRILLSPAEGEQLEPAIAARIGDTEVAATRDAVATEFLQFKKACKQNPDNVAFVYIAGHGVQLNKRGAIVLLHDFAAEGENLLNGAIDVAGCRDSMDEAGNARHQLWLSDACRQLPEVMKKFESLTSGPFKADEGIGQVDASPLFLSSSTRESAFAFIGQSTIFCQALLAGFRGEAAVGPTAKCADWHVPFTRLITFLPDKVTELLGGQADQTVDVAGRVLDAIAHRLPDPPDVELVVNLKPADASHAAVAQLLFNGSDPREIDPAWPLRFRGDAGLYLLKVDVGPPLTNGVLKPIQIAPPSFETEIEVS